MTAGVTHSQLKVTSSSKSGGICQVPGQRGSSIKIGAAEARGTEELECASRIRNGIVGHEYSQPTVGHARQDGLDHGVPFLSDECRSSNVGADGRQGDHMDTLNVLLFLSEVRCVIDLVHEGDTRSILRNKCGGLYLIVRLHEHVALHRSAHNGQHKVASSFHRSISDYTSPELHSVDGVVVLRTGFFVLAVGRGSDAVSPGVSSIPIEGSELRECSIRGGRIGEISDDGVDPSLVLRSEPGRVNVRNDSSRVDKVPVVEVVIVVPSIAKVAT